MGFGRGLSCLYAQDGRAFGSSRRIVLEGVLIYT